MLIYTEYIYALEIAAVILLVAIIAAIALTLRKRKDTKPSTRPSRPRQAQRPPEHRQDETVTARPTPRGGRSRCSRERTTKEKP